MSSKNECYTYFRIVGDFDPEKISRLLNLTPQKSWKTGDSRADGTIYNFAAWEFGECSEYDIDTAKQMEQTISLLQDKIDILNHIRKENDVSFVLQIVPTVYENEPTPLLAPSLKIIDFCHATRTEIDIDMYVCSD